MGSKKGDKARYKGDPALWAREVLGLPEYAPGKVLWEMQEGICRDILTENVVIKSGNGLGKDYLAAVLILWFLCNHRNSIVLATAPSSRQVKKVIWGEVARLYENSKVRLGGRLMSMELRFGPKWYGIGFTTKETNQMVGKFSGFHADHHLIVVTEAQAVDEVTYEQLDGVGVGKDVRWYVAGNPLMSSGYFFKMFKDKRVANNFKKYSFSCYDSPNVKAGKELIKGMVTREWVEDKERKWGKDSPLFQARVLGDFPLTSVSTLLSMDECLRARDVGDEFLAKGKKCLAVDPARYGDDSSGFAVVEGGRVDYLDSESGKATVETEGRALEIIKKHEVEIFTCDDGAMGAGIYDHVSLELEEEGGEIEAQPFTFAGRPSDPRYANLGAEAYYVVCELIKKGKVRLPDNDDLFMQLCSRKYSFSKLGKILLEGKDEMKKRGLPSPDLADCIVIALFTSVQQYEQSEAGSLEGDFIEDDRDIREEIELHGELNSLTGYPERAYSEMFL